MNSLNPLQQAIQACRRHLVSAALFSALINLLFLVPMLYMLQVYDRVVPSQGKLTLAVLTLVVMFALATLALLDLVRSRLLVRAGMRLDRLLRRAVLEATLAKPAKGDAREAVRQLDVLRQTLAGTGIVALFDAPWTPLYILVCFLLHPLIGFLVLVGSLLLLLLAWANEKATHKPLEAANEAANRVYALNEQTLAVADVIRALGMRQAVVARQIRGRESTSLLQGAASLASAHYVSMSRFLRLALQSGALGLGAYLAIQNSISAGAIFAAAFLAARALSPIDQVVAAWRGLLQGYAAFQTLSRLFSSMQPPFPPTSLPRLRGDLQVENLTLANAARDAAILNNISFSVRPGDVVGVVGASGSGKTSLARLLVGAARPDRGFVRFDGADRSDWDPEQLGRAIGYLPQEASLMQGTVKENISRFGSEIAFSREEVDAATVEAARLARAHDMIVRLPGAYDYELGPSGRGLSAGQAQRIALARALYGSPALVVLDEPNSHLDADGDRELLETLTELKKMGVSVIITTHKLNVLPVIDKLMVIEGGKLTIAGPLDKVISQSGPGGPKVVSYKGAKGEKT
jgi:ATP-binding cassette subfamily C protein